MIPPCQAATDPREETQEPPRFLDEFLAYHVLLQAHDILHKGDGSGEDESGWEKLFLQLHRILGQVGTTGTRTCALTQTRRAMRIATALAGGNHAQFYRLCRAMASDAEEGLVLVRCLLHKLLPAMRRRALLVWSKVLFKKEKLRLKEVARLLCFQDSAQAAGFVGVHQVHVLRDDVDGDRQGGNGGGGGGGLDAWDEPPGPTAATTTARPNEDEAYIEPRAAPLGYPAVGQTLEERRRVRALLCQRQDAWVLGEGGGGTGGAASPALEQLWSRLGVV